MVARTPDVNGPLSTPAPPRVGGLRGLGRVMPTAAVFLLLAGSAIWGHRTGWTFTGSPRPPVGAAGPAGGLARARVGRTLPADPDVPSALRREVVIEFDSPAAVDDAGITIQPAWAGPITDAVEAPGEVRFDPARVARLGARAAGPVWRVVKVAGDPVAAGEVLALVDAADVGRAKADFQQALVQVRLRETTLANLRASGTGVSAQQVREAEAALRDAEARLLTAAQALANLDLPAGPAEYRKLLLDEAVTRMRLLGVPPATPGLDPKTATANLLPIRAPFAGVVLSADAVAGEMAEPGRPLFVVVDASRVWVTLHVRPDHAPRVAVGKSVRFRPDGSTVEAEGLVGWVGTAADETTRSIPVRAEVVNDAGRLRAGTLGQGRVVLRKEAEAVLVPHDVVQDFRGTPVVFVRHPDYLKPGGPKAFLARPVRTGARDAESVEVLAGLKAGEVVAARGSGLLLNELTRAVDAQGTSP